MRPWRYDPSPNIDKNISETLTVFPRERDMTFTLLRGAVRVFLRGFLRIYFRVEVKGTLPQEETYVLVANHSSHLDALCLFALLPLKTLNNAFAVAAKDYFFSSFFKSLFSVIVVNALPFDRKKRQRESLELCADVLNVSDNILIMFPEGTRSATGEIQSFKPGIGSLVAGTNRKIVPAYIKGAHQAWPKRSVFPKPEKVCVTIGAPMDFSRFDRNKEAFVEIAKQAEDAVSGLMKKEDLKMPNKTKYVFARTFMKTIGTLSDGIRLCYKEGLTSGKMLDYIYRNEPSGKTVIGRFIDKQFLSDPGWEAVRIRRSNLEELILASIEALRKENKPVSILDIASGPGAYILSVLEKAGGNDVFARCRDFENRWIEEGNLNAQKKRLVNIRFEQGDAFNRSDILSLTPKPNVAVASGFYDWFNDDEKIKDSIRIVYDALESGGYFVLSIQCSHPKLEFTEQVFTDFNKNPLKMTMRPKEVIAAFLKEAGFGVEKILTDDNGYYAVMKARKLAVC